MIHIAPRYYHPRIPWEAVSVRISDITACCLDKSKIICMGFILDQTSGVWPASVDLHPSGRSLPTERPLGW